MNNCRLENSHGELLFPAEVGTVVSPEWDQTELAKKLKRFLHSRGIKFEKETLIFNREGEFIEDALGYTDLLQRVVHLAHGADNTVLAEEAASVMIGLLPSWHPLYEEMMKAVEQTQTLQQIQNDPNYKKRYEHLPNKDQHLKREAITKLIAGFLTGHHIEENIVPLTTRKHWWGRLLDWIRTLFGTNEIDQLRDSMQPFQQAAVAILEDEEYPYEVSSNEFYYYLKPVSTQEVIDNKLRTASLLIKPPARHTTELDFTEDPESSRYIITVNNVARRIKNRVTDRVNRYYKRIFGEHKTSPVAKERIQLGILIHKTLENLFKEYNGGERTVRPVKITQGQFEVLQNLKEEILKKIRRKQEEINPQGNFKLYTEQVVYNETADEAGTIDLLVVFSDGSGGKFDFKTTTLKRAIHGSDVTIEPIEDPFKLAAFDIQATTYRDILQEYGLNFLRFDQIIPIDVNFMYNTVTKETSVRSINAGDQNFTRFIATARERTNIETYDQLLDKFFEVEKELRRALERNIRSDEIRGKLTSLSKAIQAIQRDHDLSVLLIETQRTIEYAVNRLGLDPTNSLYVSDKELHKMIETWEMFNTMNAFLRQAIMDKKIEEKLSEEKQQELLNLLKEHRSTLDVLRTLINQEQMKRVHARGIQEGFKTIASPQKELGWLNAIFAGHSSFSNSLIALASSVIDTINTNVLKKVKQFETETEKHLIALKQFAKSQGTSLEEVYLKYFFNPETTNMFSEYSKDFWQRLELARERQSLEDLRWMKEHFFFNKERYDIAYEEKKLQYPKYYAYGGDKLVDRMLAKWVNEHNTDVSDLAWFQSKTFLQLKNPEKHWSVERKAIRQHPALENYYQFHIDFIQEASRILQSEDMAKGFIAKVQKTLLERGWNKVFTKETADLMIQAITVEEEDTMMGVKMATGETLTIPKFFTKIPTDSEGKQQKHLVSHDIISSMRLFAKVVYSYQMHTEEEGFFNLLVEYAQNQPQYLTGTFGNVLRQEGGDEPIIGQPKKNYVFEVLQTVRDYKFYGRRFQGKDMTFGIHGKLGRRISLTKLLARLNAFNVKKTLGLNIPSAGANTIGNLVNLFSVAIKNQFFDSTDIQKAFVDLARIDHRLAALVDAYEVSQENLQLYKANKASMSWKKRYLNDRYLMIMQRKGDDLVDRIVLGAMSKNYGIDSEGNVRHKRYLPPNTKTLYDSIEIKGEEISLNVNDRQFRQFRRLVQSIATQVRGNASAEEISLIRTNILGTLLMTYKNWLPGLAKEQFGDFAYDPRIDEIQGGRMLVFSKTIFTQGLIPSMGNLMEFTREFFFGWMTQMSPYKDRNHHDAYLKGQYVELFGRGKLSENPQLAQYVEDGDITFEKFKRLWYGQLRAAAAQFRLYSLLSMLVLYALSDWDDDEEPLYQESNLMNKLYKILDRAQLDVGFFFSPMQFQQLATRPLPILSLTGDVFLGLLPNTIDEFTDMLSPQEDSRDKAGKGHYIIRMTPGVRAQTEYWDAFE